MLSSDSLKVVTPTVKQTQANTNGKKATAMCGYNNGLMVRMHYTVEIKVFLKVRCTQSNKQRLVQLVREPLQCMDKTMVRMHYTVGKKKRKTEPKATTAIQAQCI